jgi:hypothetical protein
MASAISILCVHGVGHAEADTGIQATWTQAIGDAVAAADGAASVHCEFLGYDALFEHAPLDAATYAEAMAKLLASGVPHVLGDLFARRRGLLELPERVRWTAGMVAQWISEDGLRERARRALRARLAAGAYDAVCAHSLGSLICYDAFSREPEAIAGKVFVTLGSQIGNPCVRETFAGRIVALPGARMWYHLYNPDDHVFTAEIRLDAANFAEVATAFDLPRDPLNHDAAAYLGHGNAIRSVWRELAGRRASRAMRNAVRAFGALSAKPARRALLVGINDYPDPANRLEGCVNDVFLVSAVLQECGFAAREIRTVLDARATAQGIRSRLEWLLDGVRAGDERVLFYSGHGAQIPAYGDRDEVDRVDECLVPYDFDWSPQRAVTDDSFFELYSQLPYDAYFAAIFDCCHAGGMARDGGRKVRGINPPDDIRHRALRWNAALQMWEERGADRHARAAPYGGRYAEYLGAGGIKRRLGRAVRLRTLARRRYDATRERLGHAGPYLPVLMEACGEGQLAAEYRHGVTSYGAYTYTLVQSLRSERAAGRNPSFAALTALARRRLRQLGYEQVPALLGPAKVVRRRVPWAKPAVGGGR